MIVRWCQMVSQRWKGRWRQHAAVGRDRLITAQMHGDGYHIAGMTHNAVSERSRHGQSTIWEGHNVEDTSLRSCVIRNGRPNKGPHVLGLNLGPKWGLIWVPILAVRRGLKGLKPGWSLIMEVVILTMKIMDRDYKGEIGSRNRL